MLECTEELRMKSNVGLIDRSIRVVLGLGLLFWAYNGHPWGLLGLVPLATAFMGFCPAYLPFGFSSCPNKA